jgi:hypothetical protein
MRTADLTFNIIFSPRTATYLSPFVLSLLKWSDCRYRLVANACSAEDVELLKKLAASDDRLEFLMFSETELIEHGKTLSWLQKRTDDPYFCFMDSDIIATGPFMGKVAERLEHCDVVCSGAPIWYAPEDLVVPRAFRRIQGSHLETDSGQCVASSYFVIFDNAKLSETLKEDGVDFPVARWENLSESIRTRLQSVALDKVDYDTCKVVVGLMLEQGAKFEYVWLDNLIHIGGFSDKAGDGLPFIYRGGADRLAVKLGLGPLRHLTMYLADIWYGLRIPAYGLSAAEHRKIPFTEKRILASRNRKRLNTARYFNVLLRSLIDGIAPPPLPVLGHAPAERRIAEASAHIRNLFSELGITAERSS